MIAELVAQLDKNLELQLKREIFKKSYYEFFKWSFKLLFPNEKYEDNFHVKFLCDLYQAEVERIIRRQRKRKDKIVNIPPRTSKSLITSVCLLPWAWILDPTITMIAVSFDEELTLINAQYCKDIIKSDEYKELFGDLYQIRSDVDSKGYFMNDKGGFRLSKTTGANITGLKGVLIVVDDPQNPKTAESEPHRKTTISYYTNSLYNRLTPIDVGIRIIIMQRLHEEDLTGYLLSKNPELYDHICLPAEESDKIKPISLRQFYKGGLLDPRRLGLKILEAFKKVLGTRGYAGQYAQVPAPDEGGIIKKEWFDIIPPQLIVRNTYESPIHFFIDSAYTEKQENDPTAIMACFVQGHYLYVLDVDEQYLEFPQLCSYIINYTRRFQYSPRDSKIFIEPKASGKSIAQQLRHTTDLNVIELDPPKDSKVTRAHSVTAKLEARRVRLIQGPYINEYLNQLAVFPNGLHDDKVDITVNAVSELLFESGPDFLFV